MVQRAYLKRLEFNFATLSLGFTIFYLFLNSNVVESGEKESICDKWDICSQNCKEIPGSPTNFTCSCLDEFQTGKQNRSCLPIETTIKVAYALSNSIRIINTETNSTYSIADKVGAMGVAVDVRGGYVFWTDVTEGKEGVFRAKINQQEKIETIVDTGLLMPEGITFDWVTGNIYITDSNRSRIVVCKGDGEMCTVLIWQLNMDKPREIALHPSLGLMFWTDWGDKSSIMRAYMDGSRAIPIITEDIKWPNSLAVDHGRNRLYWTDAHHDKIETSSLYGDDRQLVNMDKVKHPFSLKVFGDFIFWSDWEIKEIQVCTKFSCKSDIHPIVKSNTQINGIAIYHPAAQPKVRTNSCKGKCSHICVLAGKNYACKCPAGLKLDNTQKNCIDDESHPKFIIAHDNYIKTLPFDSIGRDIDIVSEIKISQLKNIGAITYNPINDSIFISDLTWKSIYEYNFSTKKLRTLSSKHLESVKSMSLDPIGENLYWVDSTTKKVEVMSLRTGAKTLIGMETDHPQGIVVVPEERLIFIATSGRRGGRIMRMNMNGYNRRVLVRLNSGEPIAITFNSELRRVFWIDGADGSIGHSSISGRSVGTIERAVNPFSITSFGNQLFWTDRYTQLLHTLQVLGQLRRESPIFVGHENDKKNGTYESYVLGNFFAKITIMHRDNRIYENLTRNHECSSSGINPKKCSHICLFSAELDKGTCVCPEGMTIGFDNSTCSWPTGCLDSQFECNDQKCIDGEWRCDGNPDCEDGEDEMNCPKIKTCVGETSFLCESDKSCIHSKWKCDGERDCPNGEDEFNCEGHTCAPNVEFQCNNGRCVPFSWVCDHQNDCQNGEDELNCNQTCPIGTFQCSKDKECISIDWVCDGEADCKDSSDEHGHCEIPCSSDSFRCLDHHCIPGYLACNGVNDCLDNSDEFDCSHKTEGLFTIPILEDTTLRPNISKNLVPGILGDLFDACPWDHFLCETGECITLEKVCDTRIDCVDGSDEGSGCNLSCREGNECPHQCIKTPRGSQCACYPGFKQDPKNRRGCIDIDECKEGNPCEQVCVNTRGSFKCQCHEDYALRSDRRRCKSKNKSLKHQYIHPNDRADTAHFEQSSKSGSGSRSSAGWWVFGIFLVLILFGGIVGFIFHQKRLHPKVLFERYAHHIPVKFNIRRSQGRRGSSTNEETYQDFSDGRVTSDHAGLLSNMDPTI